MKIEVAIPCYDEEVTIEKVVGDFQVALPEAEVVVYDNNSDDMSAVLAKKAGARVENVGRRGKGYVLQHVFESSEADIIVVVDGDDTYEAQDVKRLIEPLITGKADMTVGTRLHAGAGEFRGMHHFGNRLLTWMLNWMFSVSFKDILSGYRGFNRKFVESVPLITTGFEIETELMIQGLENGLVIQEEPIRYRQRPEGSESKLNTFKDGYWILSMMVGMVRDHRPLLTFTLMAIFTALFGAVLWIIGFIYGTEHALLNILRNIGALLGLVTIGLLLVGLLLNTISTRMKELLSITRRKKI
jgi:glycosyltransferase involved in cell wall biosynthesis